MGEYGTSVLLNQPGEYMKKAFMLQLWCRYLISVPKYCSWIL